MDDPAFMPEPAPMVVVTTLNDYNVAMELKARFHQYRAPPEAQLSTRYQETNDVVHLLTLKLKKELNMKMKYSLVLLVGLVGALGAGCASKPPTVGQFMIEQSQSTKELGKQWKAGKERVANGEKAIAEGEARVKEGQMMVADGKKMMEEAELIFKTRFPGQSLEGLE